MIFRAEPGALMFFSPEVGRTGIISGHELDKLKEWLYTGKQNGFVRRLIDHRIINNSQDKKENLCESLKLEVSKIGNCKAPIRSFSVPESLHIDLTTNCNIDCVQCYKNRLTPKDLDYGYLKLLIKEAAEIKVFQIAFGGGEPLVYPYILDAIKEVTSKGMACTITTNGKALDKELIENLKQAGIHHIQVSLNGSTEGVNIKSRGGYQEAVEALKNLSKFEISYGINWTARRDNLYDFDNMICLAESVGANNINVLRMKPAFSEEINEQTLTREEFLRLADTIRKYSRAKVAIKIDSSFSNLISYINKGRLSPLLAGCAAGRRFMAVDAYAGFRACSHIDHSEKFNSILDYWYNSEFLYGMRTLEESIGESCKTCSSKSFCRGCRAVCDCLYNDFYSGEVDCPAYRTV